MRQALLDEGFDPAALEGMELDEGDEDEDDEDSEEDEDDEEEEEEESEDDEDGEDAELGEDVEELHDPSDEDDEDQLEVDEPSLLNGGKRTLKFKPKRGGHPSLDDGFFDLAAFNAEIEAAESKSSSRGRLSKDDEEDEEDADEEVDYFASVDDPEAFDEEDLEGGGGKFPQHTCSRRDLMGTCDYRIVLQGLLRTSSSYEGTKSEEANQAGC